jgi:hypothetical protein
LYGESHTVITGNWFHDNGDGSGGVMANAGGVGTQIVGNVFVADEYPFYLQYGSQVDGLIAHNVFVGGQPEVSGHGSGQPASVGNVVRDNVFTGDVRTLDPGNSEHHNLCAAGDATCADPTDVHAAPVFVGGSTPTSYAGYRLAAGSPGKGAASDGTDVGIP